MKEQWFIKAIKGDFDGIAKHFNVDPVTARLLVNRHLSDFDEIEAYINADMQRLSDPSLMKDLAKGCDIIAEKIKRGKKIRIIGDYDVDGVCSTYILYDAIKTAGGDVSYDIPDRIRDGYGLNGRLIEKAYNDGVDTILTCDNGIAALDQVKLAKDHGMTVIITDHHDIPLVKPLPAADAVVDPKQKDCDYPFKGLCGAGVAYQFVRYLLISLLKCCTDEDIKDRYLGFAALATVCDVMELVGENRTIVKKGLSYIKNTGNIGLSALIDVCSLTDKVTGERSDISVYNCGFVIGPCINACGRLDSALKVMELFTCTDTDAAVRLAEELRSHNDERKSLTEEGFEKACAFAEADENKSNKVLVLYVPDCHESIVGIVAGRIKEKYHKPTLILTKAERGIKGSGRSIEEYNMFEEFSKCADLFSKFGGHPMAAGLSIKGDTLTEQSVNVRELNRRLNEETSLTDEDLTPKVHFDMVLPFSYITEKLVSEWSILEPYGNGNDTPLFARKDIHVKGMRVLGKNRNVVRLLAADGDTGTLYTLIKFGDADDFLADLSLKAGEECVKEKLDAFGRPAGEDICIDIVYYPQINVYNGNKNIQMVIDTYR